ncbi:MAG: hypothetical protein Q7R58_02785 [bacterium]|nr:hypothetical protein [bacterium]
MKWYILTGAAILTIAVGGVLFFLNPPQEANTTQPIPGLPVAGTVVPSNEAPGSPNTSITEATMSFSTPSGAVITVKDFIHNGETVPDVQNPGSYVLAGSLGYCLADGSCPRGAPTTNFSVLYNEKIHFFNIVLLKEPLGAIRLEAEQFLINRLGITEQQACSLNYSIGAPYWVNETYDDKNLGFSFCPGATKLPQ